MNEIEFTGQMQMLSVQPGDVIVIMSDTGLSQATRTRMREMLVKLFPDNKSLILEDGLEIGVIRKE